MSDVKPRATSDTGIGQQRGPSSQQTGPELSPEPTGWAGMALFAAMMMIMLGCFQAIVGLVAIFDDGYYLVASNGLVVSVDYTTWGWVHLGVGALALAAGLGLAAGSTWARVIGIGIAIVSALLNFAFIAAYPFWSITMITLDVLIIYAIAAHGRELKQL